jgi:exosortase
MGLDPSPSSLTRRLRDVPPGAWAAGVVALALIVSYAHPIRHLIDIWWSEPSYSHGFLVVPIGVLILWLRRDRLAKVKIQPNILGWAGLLALLAVRYLLFQRNELWMEEATIPFIIACLILAFGGWGLLLWAAPGLLFSGLMLPLPPTLNLYLAAPLQTVATMASAMLLVLVGLPVLSEGHIIFVGTEPLEVARACNGLSMLLSFVTLIAAVVLLASDRPMWERIVLFLSTIPIALASNILRIVITAWCYYLFGSKAVVNYGFGKTTVGDLGHDAAGWGMMPIALGLVLLELKVLSWLIVPEEVRDKAVVFLPQEKRPQSLKKPGKKPRPIEGQVPDQLGGPVDLS